VLSYEIRKDSTRNIKQTIEQTAIVEENIAVAYSNLMSFWGVNLQVVMEEEDKFLRYQQKED
jgi:hypothetical protein